MLDGVFAFILYDTNKNLIYMSRDIYGIRSKFVKTVLSLYTQSHIIQPVYLFSSELKTIVGVNKENTKLHKIEQFIKGIMLVYICGWNI